MKRNFKPSFKEKDKEQFYFDGQNWVKCSEKTIESLWGVWVVSKNTYRYIDDDSFLVFGNYENES